MRYRALGTVLARVVAMALPLAGCCETTRRTALVNAQGQPLDESADAGAADAATVGPGSLDCRTLCVGPIAGRCMNWEIDRCERADSVGRAVRCHYVDTQCPDNLPVLRAVCGRRTRGVDVAPITGDDTIGRALGAMAALEAASVRAFARLERELVFHGAPPSLRRAAARARRDEVRHAAVMGSLARARGGDIGRVIGRAGWAPRTLAAVAMENVVEGCVRETWGAAVAAFQSRRAVDAEVRGALATIARDEARHAALAWRVYAWARPRLDEEARSACGRAMRAAVTALKREVAGSGRGATGAVLGVPTGAAARAMAAALDDALWGQG